MFQNRDQHIALVLILSPVTIFCQLEQNFETMLLNITITLNTLNNVSNNKERCMLIARVEGSVICLVCHFSSSQMALPYSLCVIKLNLFGARLQRVLGLKRYSLVVRYFQSTDLNKTRCQDVQLKRMCIRFLQVV